MTDENLRQGFLQEAAQYELTAEKIVETVKIKETSILQVKAINHDAKESIDYIKDKTRKYKKFENKKKTHNIETKNNKKCGRCNLEHPPKQCRAYNQKCMKCKKIGHWAICCKNNCRETNEIIKENIKFLGEIKESINQKEEDWTRRVGLQIGSYQEQVSLKIDTCASVTVIPFSKSLPQMRQSTTILKGPNNTHIKVIGCFDAIVTYKGKSMKEEIFILEKQTVGLLSRRLSVGLGIVKLIDEIDNRLFEGLGSLEYTYKIEMNDNIKPTSIYVPRKPPDRLIEIN